MNFYELIKPELLILIPVLYLIGVGLKKSKLPDKWIPLLLGAFSVLLSFTWIMATESILSLQNAAMAVFVSATQGILIAGASVYINQIYLQSKKDE